MKWPSHGANPHYLYKTACLAQPKEVLDFSANINPLGPPPSIRENWEEFFQGIGQYPDPNTALLKEKIAEREGVSESQILIGNGGAEIISLVGRLLAGKRVLIVEPAFSEYEQACRVNKCTISYFQLEGGWEIYHTALKEKISKADAVFLCNPNNPTGVYYGRDTIASILDECKRNDCFLIVDEAFYDFVDDYQSLVPLLKEYHSFILLRSLTKMYAIPGLRLGYAMANKELIAKLAKYQSHWSVNSIAIAAGILCVEDDEHIRKTLQVVSAERERLFDFYANKGFDFSRTRVNFYLLRDHGLSDQYPLFSFLLEKGIVPRHTFNFPGLVGRWLRFAIRGSKENDRLMEAIAEWRKIHPSSL